MEETLNDLDDEFETAMNGMQDFVDQVSQELRNFVDKQRAELSDLTSQLELLLNSAKVSLVKSLRENIEIVKNEDTLPIAARKALYGIDKLQQGAFDTLDGLMKIAMGTLVNVEHFSLEGSIAARGPQMPFVIIIKGQFGRKKDFEFRLEWVPWRQGADDTALFKRLRELVLSFLNGEHLGVSKLKED